MSSWDIKIAWRYLFAKKSQNAINIVSGVSAAGVCVATAALVCILSVMNGFNRVIEGMFSQFDPELVVRPAEGKYFSLDAEPLQALREMEEVAVFSPTVEETAMISYKNHQTPARLKGVDSNFAELTHIDSIITDGYFEVYDGAFERCVLGRGLASEIGINAHFVGGLHVYAPKRRGRVNLMRPDQSLNREVCFIAGTFAVQQVEYDDHLMLVSLSAARRLFDYSESEATAVELRLKDGVRTSRVQKKIQQALGPQYQVLNRYEQKEDFFRIARVEKWLCALLLLFILLIASFNIVGSLSMLMLDKQEDIQVLRNLGASASLVRRIFLYEGWLISALGAMIGLVLGLTICILQEQFGFITLGNGYEYALAAYPVAVDPLDILIITPIVLGIGFLAAWYPTRSLTHEAR